MLDEDFRVRRQRRWVDLTPLVDLTYILFIFFMVTTTFAKTGVPLTPPRAKHIAQTQSNIVNIYIDRDGLYFHDKDQLTGIALSQLIRQAMVTSKDTLVVLNPDKDTHTQTLMDVIDICKDAGALNFSIASIRKQ